MAAIAVSFTACLPEFPNPDGSNPDGTNPGGKVDYNSLNGSWVTSLYDTEPTEIKFSGDKAVFVRFGTNWVSPGWKDVYEAGFVKKDDLIFKNVYSSGNRTYTCLALKYHYNFYDEITKVEWYDGTITLANDGKTFEVEANGSSAKYYRKVN